MEFNEKLRNLLEDKHLTQKQFAEAANMNYAHANKFFLGRAPSMDFIQKVVKVFPEVDLNWLLLSQRQHNKGDQVSDQNSPYVNGKAMDCLDTIEQKVSELRKLLAQS